PPKGQTVKTSMPIVLKVSGGGVAVPNVVGESESQAISTLNRDGLKYQIITQAGPPGTPPGMVWKTTPKAGVAVLPRGAVRIYVSPQTSPSTSILTAPRGSTATPAF